MTTDAMEAGKAEPGAASPKGASREAPRVSAVERDPGRPASMKALALAMLFGVPLVGLFGQAMADGTRRTREAPLRATLGSARFEQLRAFDAQMTAGDDAREAGSPHYYGTRLAAPEVELTRRDGSTWRLSDHRGKVVLMNFWSITCPPCVEEMPSLELLAAMVAGRDDVEVVAVSTDEGWDAVSRILPAEPRLTHLFDPDKSTVEGAFGTRLYPETWIIDEEGVIRLRFDGAQDWSAPLVLDLLETLR